MNKTMMKALLETMRPRQWTKNGVIFAGVLFSLQIFHLVPMLRTIAAFFLFCLISGSVYILNDICDYQRDLAHPEKRNRPIPSGRLPRGAAAVAGIGIVCVTLLLSFALSTSFGYVALIYFLVNVAYSFALKHIVIVDVLIIALGFVLRAVAGVVVIEGTAPTVEISPWLLICTFLLALFLALCKRRHELNLVEQSAANHRIVLKEYTPELLDQMISVVTASSLMAYALYTISDNVVSKFGTQNLIFTVPFVLFAIFRYLYLVVARNQGGSPEKLLVQDKAMVIDIGLWVVTVITILYFA